MFISYCKGSHSAFDFLTFIFVASFPLFTFQTLRGFVFQQTVKITFGQWQPWKMQHCSLCPKLLRRCSLLKISPFVKAIGTCATRPDSLLCSTLYPKQCKTLVFCSASTSLLCGGKVHHRHTLICTTVSKSALIFFMCNSRVTELTRVNVPWNCVSWKSAWTGPLTPVSAPNYLCTLTHPCRCFSKYTCVHAGWCMNARSSHPLFTYAYKHTCILKCTHPFPFCRISFAHIHRPFWKLLFSERFYL